MKVGPAGGAIFSWYDIDEKAKPISAGMVSANTCSSAASAWPEVKPGAGEPWTSTERCSGKPIQRTIVVWTTSSAARKATSVSRKTRPSHAGQRASRRRLWRSSQEAPEASSAAGSVTVMATGERQRPTQAV